MAPKVIVQMKKLHFFRKSILTSIYEVFGIRILIKWFYVCFHWKCNENMNAFHGFYEKVSQGFLGSPVGFLGDPVCQLGSSIRISEDLSSDSDQLKWKRFPMELEYYFKSTTEQLIHQWYKLVHSKHRKSSHYFTPFNIFELILVNSCRNCLNDIDKIIICERTYDREISDF